LSEEKRFNTMDDLIDESDGAYGIKKTTNPNPTYRDIAKDRQVFKWRYLGSDNKVLNSKYGMELRIFLQDDIPFAGEKGTGTLYCAEFDEV